MLLLNIYCIKLGDMKITATKKDLHIMSIFIKIHRLFSRNSQRGAHIALLSKHRDQHTR